MKCEARDEYRRSSFFKPIPLLTDLGFTWHATAATLRVAWSIRLRFPSVKAKPWWSWWRRLGDRLQTMWDGADLSGDHTDHFANFDESFHRRFEWGRARVWSVRVKRLLRYNCD